MARNVLRAAALAALALFVLAGCPTPTVMFGNIYLPTGVPGNTAFHVLILAGDAALDPTTVDLATITPVKLVDGKFPGDATDHYRSMNFTVGDIAAGNYYAFAWVDVDGDSAFSTAHDFWGFQDAALGESPALMQPTSPNLVVADTPGVVGLEIWCGTTPTPRGGTVIGSVSEYRHGVAAGTPYHVRLLAATTAAFDPQTTDPTTVAAAKTFDGTFVGTGGLVWTGNYSVSAVPAGQYYGFAWIDENNNTTFEAASDTWGFYQPYSNAPALSMPQVANITVTDAGFADIDLWCSAAWEEGGTIVGGVTLPYTNVHAGTPFHVLVLASDTPQVPMYDNMDASYVPDLGTPIQSADGAFVDQGDGVGWSIDYRVPSVPVGDFYLLVWVDVGGPTAQEPDGIFNPGYGDLWGFYDPTNLGSLQINWPSSANLTTTGGIFHADVWCDGVPVF